MVKTEIFPYQLHLNEELPETVCHFKAGTVIYPLNSKRGVLQSYLIAQETSKKYQKLKIYKSLKRIDLYFDNHYWSLPEGTLFTAYSSKKYSIKLK
jgi:hypothetical protein